MQFLCYVDLYMCVLTVPTVILYMLLSFINLSFEVYNHCILEFLNTFFFLGFLLKLLFVFFHHGS